MAEINGMFIGNVSFQNFLLFLFVVIITILVGAILNSIIIRLLREKVRPVVYKTISKAVMYSLYAAGFSFAFTKIISFNITASLAALGVLGIALLLPTVPILQNIAAGIIITIERPFKEEDIVKIEGKLCKVKDIMLRKTKLRSLDGEIIIVPNLAFMTGTSIVNYTEGEFIKVALEVVIAADSDIDKAVKIIEKICYENTNILPNVPEKKLDRITKILEIPRNFFKIHRNIEALKPKAMVKNINKEKITLEVWFWIWNILTKEHIVSSFYKKLKEDFKKDDIQFG